MSDGTAVVHCCAPRIPACRAMTHSEHVSSSCYRGRSQGFARASPEVSVMKSVLHLDPPGGGPIAGVAGGVVGPDAPPHLQRRQRARAELRGGYRLVQDKRTREGTIVINLDRITGSPGDVTPVERDVGAWSKACVGGWADETGRRQWSGWHWIHRQRRCASHTAVVG